MTIPLVSIITPCYHGEDTLKRAIDSVLQQDFLDWEMIIISDDGKDYQPIVEAYGIKDERLRFTSTGKTGSGESNARNKGIEAARGEYIACLDCDDAFKPNKLSCLIPLAEKYGAAISSIEYRDDKTGILLENLSEQPNLDALDPKTALLACYHTCTLYLYDRKKIELWYETEIMTLPDMIFLMSFFNTIETIGYHQEPLHIYYKRDGSLCNSHNTQESFIASKHKILQKLNSNQITIQNANAQAVVKKYIELSLKLEDIYTEKVKQDPNIKFSHLLKSYLTIKS